MINAKDLPNEVLFYALNEVINVLIRKYDELGLRASSEWAESLEVRIDNSIAGTILGTEYTEQLVHGRESGTPPPIDPIQKWVQNKLGITGKRGRSIAFAVANKIGKEGTEIFKKGGTDLLEVLDEKSTMEIFTAVIVEYYRDSITNNLVENLKSL